MALNFPKEAELFEPDLELYGDVAAKGLPQAERAEDGDDGKDQHEQEGVVIMRLCIDAPASVDKNFLAGSLAVVRPIRHSCQR